MPWTCIRCESINIDSDDVCEVCDEWRGYHLHLQYQRQSIAAGFRHSLAITESGTVIGWGGNDDGEINIPEDLRDVVAVAANHGYSLALRANGTVVAWGRNVWGQCDVPTTLNSVIAVDAGLNHSLALRANGTVIAWGNNESGQCDIPEYLTNVVAIAAGANHSLALRTDGTVVAWGRKNADQCDVPEYLTNVVAISCGSNRSYALTHDGQIIIWGIGQTSIDVPHASSIAAKKFGPGIVVLSKDKTIITFPFHKEYEKIIHKCQDIIEIAGGTSHYLVRKADGTIYAWGDNSFQKFTIPLELISTPASGASIAAGSEYSLAITNERKVIGWGSNSVGEITIPTNLYDVIAVAAGASHSLALTAQGKIVEWGATLFHPDLSEELNYDIMSIASGTYHSLALRANGTVIAWGDNESGQCEVPAILDSVTAIAAGYKHSLALKANGTVVAWGDNDHGECDVPEYLTNVMAIAAGYFSYALTKTGEIVMWGVRSNSWTLIITIPNAISITAQGSQLLALTKDKKAIILRGDVKYDLHDVIEIAVSRQHTLVRKKDGSIFAWGNNDYQQCKIPSELSITPVMKTMACKSGYSIAVTYFGRVAIGDENLQLLDIPTGVSQVAIGSTYALALFGIEMVYIWQNRNEIQQNHDNLLLFSEATNSLTYFPIPHAVAVAAGGEQYYALVADGSVVEILFHDDKPHRIEPVPHIKHARAIAVGSRHALALKSNGKVIAWGNNSNNQCDVPATLDSVIAIAAGDTHSLALKANGTVVAWGNNIYGQCQIPRHLRNVTAIAAGDSFSVVLTAYGSVKIFGQQMPSLPPQGGFITAIAASGRRVMYLLTDGNIEICQQVRGINDDDITYADD